MLFNNIDGHQMAYRRLGNKSGETILLVHGITTYSFIWRKIIPFFEKDYDVIAIDLIGCGESDMSLELSYSLKEHSLRLFKFVNNLKIQSFHLVGHDVGGGIAQIFSINHEEMLKSVTMINMVAYDYWPVQPITAMRIPVIRQFLMGAFEFGLLKVIIKAGLYHKRLANKELVELFAKPLATSAGRKAFMHFAKALDCNNLMEIAKDLKKLKVSTLILRGDADPFLSSIIAEKLHMDILNSQFERIKTASHYLMEDEPQWVAEKMLAFFKSNHHIKKL